MGGAGGHMTHLAEDMSLTFADVFRVIDLASTAKLQHVTEKVDGQNIYVTWNESLGALRAARNKGDLKSGGMDAAALAAKFAGRGSVEEAFTSAFAALHKAIAALGSKSRVAAFGRNGDVWFSVEIMTPRNPNVVMYGSDYLVFHRSGTSIVDDEGNKVHDESTLAHFDALMKNVGRLKATAAESGWTITGPALVTLKRVGDGLATKQAKGRLKSAMSEAGCSMSSTLGKYLLSRIDLIISDELPDASDEVIDALSKRISGLPGAPSLNDVAKKVGNDKALLASIRAIAKKENDVRKQAMAPIDAAITDFATEILRGVESAFVLDNDKEIKRIRGEVTSAIQAIKSSGDEMAMQVLQQQLERLGNVDQISSAMEGIVFMFNGKAYKLTGRFAPVGQILGLFKYGRGGTKLSMKEEGLLRTYIGLLV